jgi:hypothetical protein
MRSVLARALACAALCTAPVAADEWPAYLDYAYVYVSAEPDALRARLAQYGQDAGIRLEDYTRKQFGPGAVDDGSDEETRLRRAAVAELLLYLASGEPEHLDRSVDTVRELEDRLTRHENRYWYHTVLAHHALERGQRFDFVAEVLDLWLYVVVPLETPYETLQTLSLGDAPNSGFVAALPYLYENVARLVLLRSQRMGVDRDLDPLGAIVRLLADGRIGTHPDVIPVALSSREYVERITARLDGPESDVGSLTFTLALFEATKLHERARSLLAEKGFGEETVEAMRVAAGAYEKALARRGRPPSTRACCASSARATRRASGSASTPTSRAASASRARSTSTTRSTARAARATTRRSASTAARATSSRCTGCGRRSRRRASTRRTTT